ncbi:MAG TPA: SMP-30/gluconolactonase/LRE family protein [Pseudonocardiaceae bacterium]|nr:SMP-30/gluconolactonase/LRE family protein [Pseudonocardiaceae bacterium]
MDGIGPEDVLLDGDGGIITGVADGRVLRIGVNGGVLGTVVDTGGRPLGLEWLPDGRLLVCDGHRGLLAVDITNGRIEVLVYEVNGAPMRFCNNAAVAPDGTVYFTDSSRRFGIEHYRGDLLEHSGTGRLLRRDPGGEVEVLLDGLQFPNGVALDPSGNWLALAETASYRLSQLWLRGARAGEQRVLADSLPGFPDNLSTGSDGLIWVALPSPRNRLLDLLLPRAPVLRRIVWALPEALQPAEGKALQVLAFDADGAVVHDLRGSGDEYDMVTGVREHCGVVYLGSLTQRAIAVLEVP